ncbi:UNVERIFIED_CONTAM: hypothetical protein Slati_0649500 [Sesamum latifolium]|uniref:Uncharacterized protein n=1 Tax=Sesamum latifolium TaxID=2727402 RepID=A0AAW2Y3E2_9LAMI
MVLVDRSEDCGFAPSVLKNCKMMMYLGNLWSNVPQIRLSADAEKHLTRPQVALKMVQSLISELFQYVSPVLKSPTPSVHQDWTVSRKSLRTSSTAAASQSIPTQSKLEAAHASIAKPSNSICFNFLSNRKPRFASTQDLAATLHRGLEIIES